MVWFTNDFIINIDHFDGSLIYLRGLFCVVPMDVGVVLLSFYLQYTKYIIICYVFVSVRYFLFILSCPIGTVMSELSLDMGVTFPRA
jgi:hypothetical protein